jgi:hypothetical protein
MSSSLFSNDQSPDFRVGVIRPVECLSLGWRLVKDQYFLFGGFCLIILALVFVYSLRRNNLGRLLEIDSINCIMDRKKPLANNAC